MENSKSDAPKDVIKLGPSFAEIEPNDSVVPQVEDTLQELAAIRTTLADGEFIPQDLLEGLEIMAKLKVVYSPDYTNYSGRGRVPKCCRLSYYRGQVNDAKLLCRSIDELLKTETQPSDELNGSIKILFSNKFFGQRFLIVFEKMSQTAETYDREGFDKSFSQVKADLDLLEDKLKAYFELLNKLTEFKYMDDIMLLGTCPQFDWPQEVGCSHQDIMMGFTGLGKTPSQSSESDGNEELVE